MKEPLETVFDRLQQRALAVGVAGMVLCAVGYLLNPVLALRSYLVGYLVWLAIALGCMAILMLHHLAGGNWGFAVRRILEAGAKTMVLLAALFIPILVNLPKLYRWADPAQAASLGLAPFKRFYLRVPFFTGRVVFYFAVWILISYLLRKWSLEQDATGDPKLAEKLQYLSAPGILLYGFTISYAAIDWVMSLDPGFFSTIFGMIFMVLPALTALAFTVVVAMLLARTKPLSDVLNPPLFNDYGNLLLTFVMLWAYLSFAQFLIIWSGNLQDEIPWYVTRASGGWAPVAVLLIVFHFAVPFFLLLLRDVKRRMKMLAAVCIGLVVMEWLDLYWMIAPSYSPAGPQFHWTDFVAPLGIGGLWIAVFVWRLKSSPLLPLRDTRFETVAVNHAD
ncbi:MAG TPA: hypothetical protein VGW33_06660 [Terriglobia bacterium]|nr:hypothetical protein [Terriglobia bacterium]